MFKRGIMLGVAACLVAALVLSVALGQNRPAGQRGNRQAQAGAPAGQRGGQPGGQGQRFDPAQMRQMMEQRMKEQLGATDAEWKTLGPRVLKVDQLNRQISGTGRGSMMFGGRRGPQGDQGAGQGPETTAVEKASQQLRTTLENTAATPDQIKKDLTALRAAKEKAKQELVVAQQELKKTVNPRQEAQLVLMGLLD
jgi:hypothetical protein